jgi:hypothetical protein
VNVEVVTDNLNFKLIAMEMHMVIKKRKNSLALLLENLISLNVLNVRKTI